MPCSNGAACVARTRTASGLAMELAAVGSPPGAASTEMVATSAALFHSPRRDTAAEACAGVGFTRKETDKFLSEILVRREVLGYSESDAQEAALAQLSTPWHRHLQRLLWCLGCSTEKFTLKRHQFEAALLCAGIQAPWPTSDLTVARR